ncbi:sugar transferase [Saccharicrinis sp. 156]|uniref:sugar transferase n=1 Tax=Saccharicrinis sp. 156 TaxID=3417574 RepID=UPI003D356DD8
MIRQREYFIEKMSVLFQVLLTLCCFYLAWWGTNTFIEPLVTGYNEYRILFILIGPLWFLLLDHFGMGKMSRIKMYSSIFFEYFSVVGLGTALLFIFIGLLNFHHVSRWTMMLFVLLNFITLFAYKISGFKTMKAFRGRGYNYRYVLIIADSNSDYFIDRIIETKAWGYKIYGIVCDAPEIMQKYGSQYNVVSEVKSLAEIIDKGIVDEVMYCKSDFNQDKIRDLMSLCAEVGITFRMQSELLNLVSGRSHLSYFNQLPFLTFMNTPDNYLALRMKSLMDYLGAGLILLIISPVLLLIALTIKLGDGGPVFFAQTRVGQNGRLFQCLKFRTMVTNAEDLKHTLTEQNEQEGPVFKMKNDPRVTRVGRFLRKTSLDELPQFINVLKGEMSIVGPRPPVPAEVEEYVRWQRRRLSMKPGITCIWQVSGRNNIPFEQWMKMDMQYIDTWSLKLDIMLFLKTFKVMLIKDGQ